MNNKESKEPKSGKFFALKQKERAIARGVHKRIREDVITALVECEFDIHKAAKLCRRGIDVVSNIARGAYLEEQIMGHKKTLVTKLLNKMWEQGVEGNSFQDRKMLVEMFVPELADSGVRRQLVANKGALDVQEHKAQKVPTTPKELIKMIQRVDPAIISQEAMPVLTLEEMPDGVSLNTYAANEQPSVEHYTQPVPLEADEREE